MRKNASALRKKRLPNVNVTTKTNESLSRERRHCCLAYAPVCRQQREEEERIAAIQRQKEQEEYDAMKASFVVEESGTLMDEQPEV